MPRVKKGLVTIRKPQANQPRTSNIPRCARKPKEYRDNYPRVIGLAEYIARSFAPGTPAPSGLASKIVEALQSQGLYVKLTAVEKWIRKLQNNQQLHSERSGLSTEPRQAQGHELTFWVATLGKPHAQYRLKEARRLQKTLLRVAKLQATDNAIRIVLSKLSQRSSTLLVVKLPPSSGDESPEPNRPTS